MADLEERPSKIRKLNKSPEDEEEPSDVIPLLQSSIGLTETTNGDDAKLYPGIISHDDSGFEKLSSDTTYNGEVQDGSQLPRKRKEKQKNPPQLPNPSSKSQLKKAKKKKDWEEGREDRKVKRKEKEKEKKARKAEEKCVTASEVRQNTPDSVPAKRTHQRPIQVPITLLIDCDFDELMMDKEITSLSSQLTRCYSDNKTSPYRSHLVVSSFRGQLKQRFETVLSSNHLGWKGVKFTDQDFVAAAAEAHTFMQSKEGGRMAGAFLTAPGASAGNSGITNFDLNKHETANMEIHLDPMQTSTTADATTANSHVKGDEEQRLPTNLLPDCIPDPGPDNRADGVDVGVGDTANSVNGAPIMPPRVVYLSSDSEYTLDVLSPYTTYIIGGLVDKNRHKGICYKRACERGIPTAKLPIGEYMSMQSRTVLTTNHVVEIMVQWLQTGDWGKAFLQVIPKRKEAKLRTKQQENGGENLDEEEDENGTPGDEADDIDESRYSEQALKENMV